MIEVRHFKLIDTVARVGSLTKAAEELCLTQSALSHQVRELEQYIGTPIFYRINNQLHFTPAGKDFREVGVDILERLRDLETRLKQLNQNQLKNYVHGFSDEEMRRLNDQASSISELLHWDSRWPANSLILEAGCGVGAQTKIIAPMNPDCQFISVDLSTRFLQTAAQVISDLQVANVKFQEANVLDLPFEDETFDHVFVCFLLEHLAKPESALAELRRVLKVNGSITVIEGDHGSTYFHPDSASARNAVQAQVNLQKQNGGNANIGRELFPLLSKNRFSDVIVNPRVVYVDDSKKEMVEGFTKNTFTAMIKGIADEAISKSIISKQEMENGIKDLYRTAEPGGSFSYTFFKAVAFKR
jgi:SAM-dependent methyltransferase